MMRSAQQHVTPSRLRRGHVGMAIALAVSAGLALAGCSGGIANKGSGASASGDQKCGSTVSIGAVLPFSGPLQEFGTNSFQGAQVAVDEINKAGGIHSLGGAKLALVKGDAGADPATTTSATTQLVNQKVAALTGAWLSTLTTTASAVAQSSQVPLLSQSWADALSSNGNQFYFQPPVRSSLLGAEGVADILSAAKTAGVTYHRVVAVAPNDVSNQTQYTAAVKALTEAGIQAAAPSFYTAGLTDATPIVNQVKAANPDLVMLGGTPADSILLVKALRSAGITAPLASIGGGFAEESFAKALGDNVNGIMDITVWNDDLKLDGVADASAAYEKKYGTTFMPVEAGETWVNIHDIAAAMEKAKSCKPTDIAAALRQLDVTSGPASAIPGGGVAFGPQGYNTKAIPILIQWQNGVPVTIAPNKLMVKKFIAPTK